MSDLVHGGQLRVGQLGDEVSQHHEPRGGDLAGVGSRKATRESKEPTLSESGRSGEGGGGS